MLRYNDINQTITLFKFDVDHSFPGKSFVILCLKIENNIIDIFSGDAAGKYKIESSTTATINQIQDPSSSQHWISFHIFSTDDYTTVKTVLKLIVL